VAEGRRWHLYRLKADGKHVEEIEVRLGFEEGDRVEILEVVSAVEPLLADQQVISAGASALSEDALVKVMEPEGEEKSESEDEKPGETEGQEAAQAQESEGT
jgi:hypothetical protein